MKCILESCSINNQGEAGAHIIISHSEDIVMNPVTPHGQRKPGSGEKEFLLRVVV